MNTEQINEGGISEKIPSLSSPVDEFLKDILPFLSPNGDTSEETEILVDKLEISMRSHLLTLTQSLVTASATKSDDEKRKLESSEEVTKLIEYLQSCLSLKMYLIDLKKKEAEEDEMKEEGQTNNNNNNTNYLFTTEDKKRLNVLLYLLLDDAFDTIPPSYIQAVWNIYLEDRQTLYKLFGYDKDGIMHVKPVGESYTKILFIRMCNKVCKRLYGNSSTNEEFKGKILVMLAKVFDLSDRSAVNVLGKPNSDKEVDFDTEEEFNTIIDHIKNDNSMDQKDDSHHHPTAEDEIEEGEEKTSSSAKSPLFSDMDYTFYKTFWGMQKFFSGPMSLLSPVSGAFDEFKKDAKTVLDVFDSHHFNKYVVKEFKSK